MKLRTLLQLAISAAGMTVPATAQAGQLREGAARFDITAMAYPDG